MHTTHACTQSHIYECKHTHTYTQIGGCLVTEILLSWWTDLGPVPSRLALESGSADLFLLRAFKTLPTISTAKDRMGGIIHPGTFGTKYESWSELEINCELMSGGIWLRILGDGSPHVWCGRDCDWMEKKAVGQEVSEEQGHSSELEHGPFGVVCQIPRVVVPGLL